MMVSMYNLVVAKANSGGTSAWIDIRDDSNSELTLFFKTFEQAEMVAKAINDALNWKSVPVPQTTVEEDQIPF